MTLFRLLRSLGVCTAIALLWSCAANLGHSALPLQMTQSAPRPGAAGLQDIYNFQGSPDGQRPESAPTCTLGHGVQHVIETCFGTTAGGGDAYGDGTVYGLTLGKKGKWTESVLYAFRGGAFGDGSEPVGIAPGQDPEGNPDADVSAVAGGTSGNGALVVLTPTSSGSLRESFIYSFGGSPDGAHPWGRVVEDNAGNLYGTTEDGGTYYGGTVYRMAPEASSYTESVLYSFGGGSSDGAHPLGGLVIDKKGALYGTTSEGGSAGAGTVFKLTPAMSGYTESVLYTFQGQPGGSKPEAGLTCVGGAHSVEPDHTVKPCTGVAKPTGPTLYGTTVYGGANNDGTVFKLTPSGKGYKETVVWNFGSIAGDGVDPSGGVCVSAKGVIYGTTIGGGSGGSSGMGTVFALTPSGGAFTESLYSFTGADGAYPFAGPSIDTKGNMYVTAEEGGTNNDGVTVKLPSFPANC